MNTSTPKVSVIIPTYNRAYCIERAVNSALSQTYHDYEIIVIDDGSTDTTRDILKKYDHRITHIYQPNRGISNARNHGIRLSKGKYIAFLDSDDTWIPEKLAIQVKLLEDDSKLGIVCSKMIILDNLGNECGIKPEDRTGNNFKELIEIGGDLPTSSVMTRRECFDKVGMFDESLAMMEDFEMWVRIASQYDIYFFNEKILAYYYQHDHQITKNKILVYESYIQLQEKLFHQYNTVPDFPNRVINNRIANNEYVLSRIYFNHKTYVTSFNLLIDSLKRCPLVGLQFINKSDSTAVKCLKFIKPYGYFIVSIYCNFFPLKNSRSDEVKEIAVQNTEIKTALPDKGKVSVIIPSYNCRKYIRESIESILNQTFKNYEIIVIDDGSVDNTKEVLEPYIARGDVQYYYQENGGISKARNYGISKASGEYILILDADDKIMPNTMAETVASMIKNNSKWVIVDYLRVENEHENVIRAVLPNLDNPFMDILWNTPQYRGIMYDKKSLQEIGCYDPAQRIYEDWDLYVRLLKRNIPFSYVPQGLYRYQIRSGSLTKKESILRNLNYIERIYNKHCKSI